MEKVPMDTNSLSTRRAQTWRRQSHWQGLALVAFLVCSLWQVPAQTNEQYTFLTLAGPPHAGAGSLDGTWSEARFNRPSGVAVDSAGNLFVADTGNGTIRKGIRIAGGPFWLSVPGTPANGQFTFNLHGDPGQAYEVQTSTNLRDWTPLTTLTLTSTTASFTNSMDVAHRFYRLRLGP